MSTFDASLRAGSGEGELYYLHPLNHTRSVEHTIEFLSVSQLLDDESACQSLWEMITTAFKTRRNFFAIWPHVRFVAVHRSVGELLGALLVSTPLNWQIDYVVVRPDKRCQGIALSLVNETLNQALMRDVPYVMLTSRKGLRPLYEGACGFTVVGGKPSEKLGMVSTLPVNQPVPTAILNP